MNPNEIKITSAASRTWMLHEHHGWTCLARNYGTRAEFDAVCDYAISRAAESEDSPVLFERDDFLNSDYESQFASIKPETTHILTAAGHSQDIEQFSDAWAARKAYTEACRAHGLDRLTCDRGGHSGPSERIDVEAIRIYVTAPSGSYKFDYASAESEVEFGPLLDAGIPTGEIEAIRLAIKGGLAAIAAE